MKKERRFGVNHLTSENHGKFISEAQAIMALQAIEFLFALQGYNIHSSIDTPNRSLKLTIHFSDKPFPTLLHGYKYTWRDITSHTYWDKINKQPSRIRCVDYYFEYDK